MLTHYSKGGWGRNQHPCVGCAVTAICVHLSRCVCVHLCVCVHKLHVSSDAHLFPSVCDSMCITCVNVHVPVLSVVMQPRILEGWWSSDRACQSLWLISLLPLPPSFQSDPCRPLLPLWAPWWLITQSVRQVAVTSPNTSPTPSLKRYTGQLRSSNSP